MTGMRELTINELEAVSGGEVTSYTITALPNGCTITIGSDGSHVFTGGGVKIQTGCDGSIKTRPL